MSKSKIVDFGERVGATFAQAFLALAVVSGLGDMSMLKAAAVAGGIAAGKFALVEANAYLKAPAA